MFDTCPTITQKASYGDRQVDTQVHMGKQTYKNTQERQKKKEKEKKKLRGGRLGRGEGWGGTALPGTKIHYYKPF